METPYNFIVIEGTDGSGKTTLSKRLHESIPKSILTHEENSAGRSAHDGSVVHRGQA